MRQNAFAARLCPGPRWGILQRYPDPLSGFAERSGEGRGEKGKEGKGREKAEIGEGREEKD